jgi:hydroxyacylglutathione hydrolase
MMVWPGHGAGSACGKALGAVPESTVGYEKRFSPALAAVNAGEEEFVGFILAGQPEPPPYFARMKMLNRDGPPILGPVPQPARVAVSQLVSLIGRSDTVVLDLRRDRGAFMAGHLLGSLHAPLNRTLPTIAGSYVDPSQTIYLVIDEADVQDAVLDLIRIGFDRIAGYVTPADLAAYVSAGGKLTSTEVIDFVQLQDRRRDNDLVVLDVRGASEYAAGHIPEALNVAHTRILPRLGEIPRDRPLALYCESGARASSAASILEREGFDVILIDDRYANWLRQNRQEVTPEPH